MFTDQGPSVDSDQQALLALAERELERWRNILFTVRMESSSGRRRRDRRAGPPAQEGNTGNEPPAAGFTEPYLPASNEQYHPPSTHHSFPETSIPPQFDLPSTWNPGTTFQGHAMPVASSSTWQQSVDYNQGMGQYTGMPASSSRRSRGFSVASSRSNPSSHASPTPEVDDPGLSEEKRRRNTEASARFRLKKKKKNLNLEKNISDLSDRADELEKEAEDLRRENGWLKEIVFMKSRAHLGIQESVASTSRGGRGQKPDSNSDVEEESNEEQAKPTSKKRKAQERKEDP